MVVLNISVEVLEREGVLETDDLELKPWILTKLINLYFPIFKTGITIPPYRAVVIAEYNNKKKLSQVPGTCGYSPSGSYYDPYNHSSYQLF